MNRLFMAKEKERLYQCYTKEQIGESVLCSGDEFYQNPEKYQNIEYIFSTWNMIPLTKEEITLYFPRLKAVFYAAGSVKYFAKPFLQSGVRVFSAWKANAVPVAEFLVAQIVLANKGYFLMHDRYHREGFQASRTYCRSFDGNYRTKVGFIGCGSITKYAIDRLKPYELDLFVCSKHLSDEEADKLGVTKESMEEIFSTCQTISNNMANTSGTENLITEKHFRSMREFSTFINTGRGAQVDLVALKTVFRERRDCVALIDVTDPQEPLPPEDDIWEIPNIFISPHSAGSTSKEVFRMGDYMIETQEKLVNNELVSHEVTEQLLETMA